MIIYLIAKQLYCYKPNPLVKHKQIIVLLSYLF